MGILSEKNEWKKAEIKRKSKNWIFNQMKKLWIE